jgi:4-amino-4-deoxy-L-arabinose transferase-like glycosyltransferase
VAGGCASTTAAGNGAPRRYGPGVLAILAAVALACVVVILLGQAQEAANVRILGVFDPLFVWIRESGARASDWLERHPVRVAGMLGGGVLLILAGAVAATRRLPAAVLAPCIALLLGIWGQALVLADATKPGVVLYLAGVVVAAAYGWWRPMRRLAGFPPVGAETGAGLEGSWRPRWPVECALVIAIGIVALIFRTWALTELSDFLDLEMVNSWVQSRTLAGVAGYYRGTFLTTNPGAAHLLPQWALFNVFGTSIFTLRMAPVLWGVAATLLLYWFVRRIAGVGPAVLAAMIFATAPDQLFWSRSENGFFSPVATLAMVTLHVCLWMATRLSARSVAVGALLMPASRYFYTTALAMFLLPLAVAAHATVFLRGAWRKLWYVLPILALGLVAWWFHLTVVLGVLNGNNFQFRHPASIYGGTAWTRQGDFAQSPALDLIRQQAHSMGEGVLRTIRDMTAETTNSFGHWYIRSQVNPHPTTMNVGIVVLLALGVGYLLGQLRDPRAWLLLVWLVLSLLGGIMSRDATPRRMSMLFPAAHIIGTVFLAAALRGVRQGAGRRVADLATAVAAFAMTIVILTNTVSHFRLPMQPVIFADYSRFLLPALRDSDSVFLNLPRPFISLLQFTDVDRFVRAPWCIQRVEEDKSWLQAALEPKCTFTDEAYGLVFTPAETEAIRARHQMRRISYVFFVDPTNRWQLDLVRALYPGGKFSDYVSPRDNRHIAVVTIDIADSLALRTPVVHSAASPAPDVLADVAEQAVVADAPPPPAAEVDGGLWLDTDNWYAFSLLPPCPGATLAIDGQPTDPAAHPPYLAGVHRFALTIPDPAACTLPLRVAATRADAAPAPLAPDRFTSPQVAALPAAAAPPVLTYAGYRDAKPIVNLPNRSADLAIGPDGNLYVAAMVRGRWHLQKYTPDGTQLGSWDIGAPRELDPGTMTTADDGTVAILFGRQIFLLGPDGRRVGTWENTWFVWETEIAFWGDRLLATIPHRDAIAVFSRTGELLAEVREFPGGPGRFFEPSSVAFTPAGDVVVLQPNGKALRLRTPPGDFKPEFVREFAVSSISPGVSFDGPDRVLLPSGNVVDVFDGEGTRLMAAEPGADLSRIKVGKSARARSRDGIVYLLDPEGGRVWAIRP